MTQPHPDESDPSALKPIVPEAVDPIISKPVERQDLRNYTRDEGSPWPVIPLVIAFAIIAALSFFYMSINDVSAPGQTTKNVDTIQRN